jgi:hypothetical protein
MHDPTEEKEDGTCECVWSFDKNKKAKIVSSDPECKLHGKDSDYRSSIEDAVHIIGAKKCEWDNRQDKDNCDKCGIVPHEIYYFPSSGQYLCGNCVVETRIEFEDNGML